MNSSSDANLSVNLSKSELELFFELTSDLMCILDEQGRALRVNRAFEQTLGYTDEDMRDRPLAAIAHPEDQATVEAAIRTLSTVPATSFVSRYLCQQDHCQLDEQVCWLAWNVSSIADAKGVRRLYCVARDVTQHKTKENSIQQLNEALESRVARRTAQLSTAQEHYTELLKVERAAHNRAERAKADMELYAEVVQNIQVGIQIWQLEDLSDERSLRLIAINPSASTDHGVPFDDLVGQTIAEVIPALMDSDVPKIYADVVRNKTPYDLGEVPYSDSRVAAGVFAVQAFPLPGRYVGVTFENITKRKEAALELIRQKDDLLTVNMLLTDTMTKLEERNQELDQFAYVTSHDLKAPLRAIANLATWIEEDLGGDLPPENVEQFELLKNRVHRMEGLINGLLEYSRVGRKHQSREQVAVGKLLSEIVDSFSPLGEFTIEVDPNMPVFSARKVPLFQVFSNLINNAIKHHDRKDGQVQISMRELDEFYEFAVADDGPGIDEKYHQKVFAIFQTLKARDELESTGIGLSIVKKTVMAEGGQISLDSALGQGATFRFTWPKASPDSV